VSFLRSLLLGSRQTDSGHVGYYVEADGDLVRRSSPNGPLVPVGGGGSTFQTELLDGSTVAAPFSITELDESVTADAGNGFISDWVTFDLKRPGLGFYAVTVTAADLDGLTPVTDLNGAVSVEASVDGVVWLTVVSLLVTGPPGASLVVVDDAYASLYPTPRAIRLQFALLDGSFDPYAGPASPSVTVNVDYVAA
jgi:hypothetical protein